MILTGRSNRDHLTLCLLAGMRKYIKEPVNNYENIKEFTQETDENPALFQGRLVETFRKYTQTQSLQRVKLFEGNTFISQSAPDIRRKLQKLHMGPQTSVAQLLDIAFGVFNTRDEALQEERLYQYKRCNKAQAQLIAVAVANALKSQGHPRGPPLKGTCPTSKGRGTCFKCEQCVHWARECP